MTNGGRRARRRGTGRDIALEAIARYFKFAERGTDFGTEIRAGLTTFLVMAYIVFLNPIILADGFKVVSGYDLNITQAAATTALVAGVLTIAMGVFTNYPFAMAAGLGLNAVVAFGLFILFIGFVDARIIQIPASKAVPVEFVLPTTPAHFVFFLGLALTIALWVMRVRGALLISILVTTAVAVVAGVQKIPAEFTVTPSFFPIVPDLSNVFNIGLVAALLTIFAIMLTDFFYTMGTVTGVAAEAGLTDQEGRGPGIGPGLLVDSLGAVAGGAAGISSNTTHIERRTEGGRGG